LIGLVQEIGGPQGVFVMRNCLARVLLIALAGLLSASCATSRLAQLEKTARGVESHLIKERGRVLAMPAGDATRPVRLDHLTQLRATLSAANIGLGTVPYLLEEAQRPMAYDVLEEVYATIDWNIPLGPDQPKKQLPAQFMGNTLNLNGSRAGSPITPMPITPIRSTP
jgi:hypothetical protein